MLHNGKNGTALPARRQSLAAVERAVVRAEQAVVGRVLHGDLDRVRALVRLDDLSQWPARLVYQTAMDLHAAGAHVSCESVYAALVSSGHDGDLGPTGAAYLAELFDSDPTGADLDYMAGVVREAARARRLRQLGSEFVRDVTDGIAPPAELAARLATDLTALASDNRDAPRFRFLTAAQFAAGDYRPDWFVRGVLVRGEPAVIAGLSKTLKTSIAVDLAVALAVGRPFLGRFDVPRRARVAVVSGESGRSTLQDAAQRIAQSKGVDHADLASWLHWCFDLPVLTDLVGMGEFADALGSRAVELVVLDPLYLMMGDVDMRNMFEAGAALRAVARLLLGRGITPVILHHANRQVQAGEPMELTHIAYSGCDQFARQWALIARRERYNGTGVHRLWLSIGGSAFTGRLWAVDVDEGQADDQFRGRRWDVTVATADEVRSDRLAEWESEREQSARRKMRTEETQVLDAIDAEKAAGRAGATVSSIRARYPNLSAAKAREAAGRLVEAGTVDEIEFVRVSGNGSRQTVTGYARTDGQNGQHTDPSCRPSERSARNGQHRAP